MSTARTMAVLVPPVATTEELRIGHPFHTNLLVVRVETGESIILPRTLVMLDEDTIVLHIGGTDLAVLVTITG